MEIDEADRPEDPEIEAQRFSGLLSLLVAHVPEISEWWRDALFGDDLDPKVLTLSGAWTVVNRRLFDDNHRPIDVHGVWPRLLRVVEVALELCDLLFDDDREEDGITVDVFAGSGVMCDITRNLASLEELLPWMGPVSLDGARIEIANHTTSRGYDADDVDWSRSGTSFRTLGISPTALIPARRA